MQLQDTLHRNVDEQFGHVTRTRRGVLATVSVAALCAAGFTALPQTAQAQTNPQSETNGVEEIVVTGSRIVRDGYDAPTPVTVVGIEEIQSAVPKNLGDYVNSLPSFANGASSSNTRQSIGPGSSGISNLNLRGLGPNRTLVLLDGQRVVGAILGTAENGGAVDMNSFPDSLVSRVDVVTGGASAAYGSDALAGVVNFVLDHDYVGIKGSVQGGVTTYGDDWNYKFSLTAGTPFAGGRGHFLISGDATWNQGIEGLPRPWNDNSTQVITNPSYTAGNGQPQYIIRSEVSRLDGIPGGVITSGPLKGVAFGPGGTPYNFVYGPIVTVQSMSGGQWRSSRIDHLSDMDGRLSRTSVYTRLSYDLADNVTVFATAQHGDAQSFARCCSQFSFANITIRQDNAFIPEDVRARMVAGNISQFVMGNTMPDMPLISGDNRRTFRRVVVGATGNFAAMDTDWTWNLNIQRSTQHVSTNAPQNRVTARSNEAIDSVRHPTTGAIVCRSTLTNPNNGCVPYNPMGIGVNTAASIDYITEDGYSFTKLAQNSVSFDLNAEPFSTWAGPVSTAIGADYRKETVNVVASALDQASAFFVGNYKNTVGAFDVVEGFAEIVVPLAKDETWARALDLNAAVRATDYSESGYVTTWKVGATYSPIDDLRFRITRSRDIRAPTLGDLFAGGTSTNGPQFDPFTNTTAQVNTVTTGNQDLRPEKADTTGAGVVFQPTFFPGFSASFDYFKIDIKDAISALNSTDILDRCFAGNAELCTFLIRDANGVLFRVNRKPANVLGQLVTGFDIETSYTTQLSDIVSEMDGSLAVRFLATHFRKLDTDDGVVVFRGAGHLAQGIASRQTAPKWRWVGSVQYNNGPLRADLTARGIAGGRYSNAYIECTTGCPTSTAFNPTIDNNRISGTVTFDLALNYKVFESDDGTTIETFGLVENISNRAPPLVAGNGSLAYLAGNSDGRVFDLIGRRFRMGVRFSM